MNDFVNSEEHDICSNLAQSQTCGGVLIISNDEVFALDLRQMLDLNGIPSVHFKRCSDVALDASSALRCIAVVDVGLRGSQAKADTDWLERTDLPTIRITSSWERTTECSRLENSPCFSKPLVVDKLLPLIQGMKERSTVVSNGLKAKSHVRSQTGHAQNQ